MALTTEWLREMLRE